MGDILEASARPRHPWSDKLTTPNDPWLPNLRSLTTLPAATARGPVGPVGPFADYPLGSHCRFPGTVALKSLSLPGPAGLSPHSTCVELGAGGSLERDGKGSPGQLVLSTKMDLRSRWGHRSPA